MILLVICILLALAALQSAEVCSNSDDSIDLKTEDASSGVLLQRKAFQLATEKFGQVHTSKPEAHDDVKEVSGATVNMNEQGYNAVVKLKKQAEFYTFIDRVLDAMGLAPVDERKMVAKFVSTKPKMFDQLIDELLQGLHGRKFLKSTVDSPDDGSDPKLNEDGYKFVLQQHDGKKMKQFIQRVALKHGFQVRFFGGLAGITPFYSGKLGIQSFEALEKELQHVAKRPNSWLKAAARTTGKRKGSEAQEDKGKQRKAPTRKKKVSARGDRIFKETQSNNENHAKASHIRGGSIASEKKSSQVKNLDGGLKLASRRTAESSEAREDRSTQRKVVTKKKKVLARTDRTVKEAQRKDDKHAKASHSIRGSTASQKKSSQAKYQDGGLEAAVQRTAESSDAREDRSKERKVETKKKKKKKVLARRDRTVKETQRKDDKHAKASHSRGGSIASKKKSSRASNQDGGLEATDQRTAESSEAREDRSKERKVTKKKKKKQVLARRDRTVKENQRKDGKHAKASHSKGGSTASKKSSSRANHQDGRLKPAAQRTGNTKCSEAQEDKGQQRKAARKKENLVARRSRTVKETQKENDKKAKASHSRGLASKKKSSQASDAVGWWFKGLARLTGAQQSSDAQTEKGQQRKLVKHPKHLKQPKYPRHPEAGWKALGNISVYIPTVVLGSKTAQAH